MRSKPVIKYVLWMVLLALGYTAGVFLHSKMFWAVDKNQFEKVDIENLLTQPLIDINNGTTVYHDTLFSHNCNLLVFWTPTCKFCRQFFQYHLNSHEIGIFCFPLTDDLDYVKYFVEERMIEYPQLGSIDSTGITSIKMPTVHAVPSFIVLDNKGNVIEQKIGINEIDTLLNLLYNQKNIKTEVGNGL